MTTVAQQVQPVAVTQVTSEAVLGIPARRFREWVNGRRVRHTRVGKLVVVSIADALAALRAEQVAGETAPTNEVERLRRAAGLREAGL